MQTIPDLAAMIRSAWACTLPPDADNIVFVQSREKGFYDEECGKIIALLDEADGLAIAP